MTRERIEEIRSILGEIPDDLDRQGDALCDLALLGLEAEKFAEDVSDLLGHEGREGAFFHAEQRNLQGRNFDCGEMLATIRSRLERSLSAFRAKHPEGGNDGK